MIKIFRGVLQSLEANDETVPQIKPRLLAFTFFSTKSSLTSIAFWDVTKRSPIEPQNQHNYSLIIILSRD
jgi:hypothetical protein